MEFGHHEGDLAVAARDEGAFAEFLGILCCSSSQQ